MSKRLHLILLLCWPLGASTHLETSKDLTWRRLLHFNEKKQKSEVDGPTFFLSPQGKYNPHAELLATLEALKENRKVGKNKTHPICAYPARYKYLKRKLNISLPKISCPGLTYWKTHLPAHSASLIFASSYANNPASLFGHTFLRFNNSPPQNHLDYGLNFSAITGNDGALHFAVYGIFGGYEGHYSLSPYHIKINEYNNLEGRDLWEYPLNLNPGEISFLLDHVWEIESTTHFDYYFFDENCSYHILSLIELVRPDLFLTQQFPHSVIPVDTVKVLDNAGLLGKVKFRSSLKRQFQTMFKNLSKKDQRELNQIVSLQSSVYETKSKNLLETLIIYFLYKKKKSPLNKIESELYNKILKQSAKYPPVKDWYEISLPYPPEKGHSSSFIGLGMGHIENQNFLEFDYRAGFHSLKDDDRGHISFSQLELLRWRGRYQENALKTHHFTLIDVINLTPLHPMQWSLSWRTAIHYGNLINKQNTSSRHINAIGGIGLASQLGPKTLFYFLESLQLYIRGQSHFVISHQVGLMHQGHKYKVLIQMTYENKNQSSFIQGDLNLRYFLRSNLHLEAQFQVKSDFIGSNHHQEITLKPLYFF